MQWLMDNWTLLASILAAAILASIKVKKYLQAEKEEQERMKQEARDKLIRAVSDWLLRAVTEAEKDLGSGTGKLKIREVYEKAVGLFGPEFTEIISLERLDEMAQKPLEEMRELLDKNYKLRAYVEGGRTQ